MPDEPTVTDMMVAYAQDAVDMVKANFGEDLDYSERSVLVVERCLRQLHDTIPKGMLGKLSGRGPSEEEIQTVAKMFGGYVGEVFRRHHGGEWRIDELPGSEGPAITIRHPSGVLSPPSKVYKRIVNGEEDNVSVYYRVLTREYIKRRQSGSDAAE